MLTSRLFGRGPGPCLVCGAQNQSCTGPDAREPARVFGLGTPGYAPEFPWRSRQRVYEFERGQRVLLYAVGTSVPLIEALRQGVVEVSQLTDEQKAAVVAHAERDPAAKAALVASLKARRPANKMVKEDQVVTKGEG